jgi:hypothetical protein
MKIERLAPIEILFKNISVGEVFEIVTNPSVLFMKVSEVNGGATSSIGYNAIYLNSGEHGVVNSETRCRAVKGSFKESL